MVVEREPLQKRMLAAPLEDPTMQENETLSVIDSLYATFLRGDLNAALDLVCRLLNSFKNWRDLWPLPMLCVFC